MFSLSWGAINLTSCCASPTGAEPLLKKNRPKAILALFFYETFLFAVNTPTVVLPIKTQFE
jgi:hypothetical protein